MERRKLLEAHRAARCACAVLRANLRSYTGSPAGDEALPSALRALLPALSILHSFSPDKEAATVYVYEILSQTIAQVLGIRPEGDVARTDQQSTAVGMASATTDCDESATTFERAVTGSNPEAAAVAAAAVGSTQVSPIHPPQAQASTPVRWSDIEGCEEAVTALRQATVLPTRFPWLFPAGGARRPWQRILLYGPPGTGKTMLARAAATELVGCPLVSLSAADVLSKWVGESERQVRAIFASAVAAAAAAPCGRCIMFLDELDALCAARGSRGESEVARRLTTELLVHLQDLPRSVVIVAATNLPWEMDSAVLRRFDAMVYVGLPSRKARRGLVARLLAGVEHTFDGEDLDWVAERTEGFSAADVVRLTTQAAMAPLATLLDATSLRLATAEEVAHRTRRRPPQRRWRGSLREKKGTGPRYGSPEAAHVQASSLRSERHSRAPATAPPSPLCSLMSNDDNPASNSTGPTQRQGNHLKRQRSSPSAAHSKDADISTPPHPPSPACFYVPCRPTDPGALLASLDASHVPQASLLLPVVTHSDMAAAVAQFVPSVTQRDVDRYTEWCRAQRAD